MRQLLVFACLGLGACGLDVVGNAAPQDAGVGLADGAPGATATIDAGPPPRPTTCATTETDCTDGIDNDCNGVADCGDPACGAQGFACVPAVPAGWSLLALDDKARDDCPPGFTGKSSDVIVDPSSAPATCGCTCGIGAQPSCVTGPIVASFGATSSCGNGSGSYSNVNGACASVGYTIEANVKTTKLAPSGGSCVPTPSTNVDTSSSQGRVCTAAGATGTGCANAGVCARAVAAPFKACVAQAGSVACAAGYPTKHSVGSTVAADTRGCTTCACGNPSATCVNAAWNQYRSSDCSGPPVPLTADNNCDPSNAGPSMYNSTKYVATVQAASCAAPSAPTPTGALTLKDEATVCCAP